MQLELKPKQLKKIGFVKKDHEGDELNSPKTTYEIETKNGYFYYNPDEEEGRWYHTAIVGEHASDICLDIERLPELFMVLACFRVKFNLVVE